ncbi:hypothetical protein GETHLI_17470 [Geothrix limicola]|uniref:DUF115 domain-containing protein n=1 Tax=Geothrix limicola TaxID=2927978 RepID=A0ABQ5QFN7_9BACT|nr:hypothetical protein [Geothrix limicola]GLH73245.1 hypothetical protein GETHLI_17470 [Geothrix limicola]
MSKSLSRLLRREQFAFLGRERSAWDEHLGRARAFLGEGLQAADPGHPVLVLGAGAGLELPWSLTPKHTIGWDADPWSRVWTALRHRRWPAWIFDDMTGGLADLEATARRAVAEPWSGHRRDRDTAARRLAGLIPFLHPDPAPLRAWIAAHRPGAILCANVMGQFGVVAERVVEAAFGFAPWRLDPETPDPLAEALEGWTGRALAAFLDALRDSGADLWLLYDRAVVFSGGALELGPWDEDWSRQLRGNGVPIEASDPLGGLDVAAHVRGGGLELARQERWIWPLAPGQRHLVEALAFRRSR